MHKETAPERAKHAVAQAGHNTENTVKEGGEKAKHMVRERKARPLNARKR
jgi:hypothetical protein